MTRTALIASLAMAFAAPALAEGDIANGEKEFGKCKSCHMIVADDGTEVVKGGKTGPNLWGISGRTAGTQDGFKYGASLVAAGEAGLVWDTETLTAYITDPVAFLKERTGDSKARSNMTFKLRKGAEDVAAYLVSLGPSN
jgi:cytochrome c